MSRNGRIPSILSRCLTLSALAAAVCLSLRGLMGLYRRRTCKKEG